MNNTFQTKKTKAEIQYLNREIEHLALPVLFMYGKRIEELCGNTTIIDGSDFASIDVLKKEIEEQRKASKKKNADHDSEDYFDELFPWMLSEKENERLVVCKEGVFEWNWEKEKYEFIGKVRRTNRQKTITILADSKVSVGMIDLFLDKNNTYLLDGEYVFYDDERNPVEMLVLNKDGYVPIAVPYDHEQMIVSDQDFIVVDYIK